MTHKDEVKIWIVAVAGLLLLGMIMSSCNRYTAVGPDGGCMFKKRTNYPHQMDRIRRF
jgi:hypothetical protein